jgi:hypothetical protein
MPGTGSDPTTESTVIFKGTGASRARGAARRLSVKIPAMCSRY